MILSQQQFANQQLISHNVNQTGKNIFSEKEYKNDCSTGREMLEK